MKEDPAKYHALERTSPKGTRFIGRCTQCGKEGLTLADSDEICDNPLDITETESLLKALES